MEELRNLMIHDSSNTNRLPESVHQEDHGSLTGRQLPSPSGQISFNYRSQPTDVLTDWAERTRLNPFGPERQRQLRLGCGTGQIGRKAGRGPLSLFSANGEIGRLATGATCCDNWHFHEKSRTVIDLAYSFTPIGAS